MAPSMLAKSLGCWGWVGGVAVVFGGSVGVAGGVARWAGTSGEGCPAAWRGGVFQSLYRNRMPAKVATTMETIR